MATDVIRARIPGSEMRSGGKFRSTTSRAGSYRAAPYARPGFKPRGGARQNAGPGKRVYVGNLSWSVKWQGLKDHMRQAGNVVRAEVLEDLDGRSKGCGIVTYATEEEARQAIEELTNTELEGRLIFVREDREEGGPGAVKSTAVGNKRVYVGNLPYGVRWQTLKDHMRQAGTVVHADVLEEQNGRSKGCGLVEFSSPEEAQKAIECLTDTELEGRQIFVREDREPDAGSIGSIARGGGRMASSSRGPMAFRGKSQIFVGNLPYETSWQDLKDYYRHYGNVERAEIYEKNGKSMGYGTVKFATANEAKNAIAQTNRQKFRGRVLDVHEDRDA